jgi:hypothetical protein
MTAADGKPGAFRGLAACVCEFAIHFRDRQSGGVGLSLDVDVIETEIDKSVGLRPKGAFGVG